MENAFSGCCEGIFLDAIWKAIPDDEEREHPWVVIPSFYLGNGGAEPLDGSCGSPVLTVSSSQRKGLLCVGGVPAGAWYDLKQHLGGHFPISLNAGTNVFNISYT